MRNLEEVNHAFTAVNQLSATQKNCMLRIEAAFKDLATDMIEYVPDCADRTAALRKILEAKFTSVQAITHFKPATVIVRKGDKSEQKSTQEN